MRTFLLLTLFHIFFVSFGQTTQEPKFTNVTINSMGDIHWSVTYLMGDGCSIQIEKLKDGKWVIVHPGVGEGAVVPPQNTRHVRTITHTSRVKFHKGTNIYRLVMTYPDKAVSDEIKLESEVSNDEGNLWIMDNRIILEESVQFEVLNSTGETVKKGDDKIIDISTLPSGSYFLYTKAWTRQFAK